MKNRSLSLLIAICIIFSTLSAVPITASASTVASGTCGNSLTWTLDSIGTLTISGTGKMTDFSQSSDTPWYSFRDNILNVVMDDGITSIGWFAFGRCSKLTNATIPNSITSISMGAFYYCESLNSLTIPDSVTCIESSAFAGCSSLENITIPDSVTIIKGGAFDRCSSLKSIFIPDSVSSIGPGVFADCDNLTNIQISNNNYYSIDAHGVLYNKNKTTLIQYPAGNQSESFIIPNSVTKINQDAFSGCDNLMSIIIPNSVNDIGSSAFSDCNNLFGLVIPNGVTGIGNSTFWSCGKLESLLIPNSVTNIGSYAFTGCDRLACVYYEGSNNDWDNISGTQNITDVTEAEIQYETKRNGICGNDLEWLLDDNSTLTISGSGDMTDWQSFSAVPWYPYVTSITNVVIDPKVTSIGNYAFRLSGLTNVTIPENVTDIGDYTFCLSSNLVNVNLPNSITSVGQYAFSRCVRLKSIDIPEGVTNIGNRAFYDCDNLKTVTIPKSVTSIDSSAFYLCDGIAIVNISNIEQWCKISFGDFYSNPMSYNKANLYLNGLLFDDLVIPNEITSIGDYTFSGCKSLTNITIPNSVTSIGKSAFSGCVGLTSIIIPDSVANIGASAFSGCSNLRNITNSMNITSISDYLFSGCERLSEITIPYGVTNIGQRAFYNCSTLTIITIPDTVKSIGYSAFEACINLTNVTMPDSVTSISSSAFYKCSSLTSIIIPSSVTSIASSAFAGCSSLTSITIPSSVTSINSSAFASCSSLTNITIPSSVTNIGGNAFYRCSSLTDIYYEKSENDWNNIKIGSYGNEPFVNANIHYNSYCISYDYLTNGGTSSTAKYDIVSDGNNANLTPTASKFGWRFVGWNTIPNATEGLTSYMPTGSVTLYAIFEQIKTPTPTSNYHSSNVEYGKEINLSVDGFSDNYIIYYTTDGSIPTTNSKSYNGKIIIEDDVTIKAIAVANGYATSDVATFTYKVPKFTISYDANGGIGGPLSQIKKYGLDLTLSVDVPTRTGFVFEGWTNTSDGTLIAYRPGDIYSSEESINLYALWNKENASYPAITVKPAENITTTSAKLIGVVEDNGGETILNRHIVYFEKNNPNALYTVDANSNFEVVISNLKESTEYWYYATANNSRGYGSSTINKFTTLSGENTIPSEFKILSDSITVKPGASTAVSYKILPSTAINKNVIWKSDNENIAKISNDGTVTGVSEGTTTITGTTEVGRLVQSCTVLVKNPTEEDLIDLSEWNMVANTSNKSVNGWNLSTKASDKQGGNIQRAISYLTRWDGPVYEKDDVYPSLDSNDGTLKELGNPAYHVQDIVFIPKRKNSLDNDAIKNAIVKYGAVHASYYSNSDLYNESQSSYYSPKASGSGHAVAIVGWNDEYSATNFKEKPAGNGAFLCKNSYGISKGENGYFYISYYDAGLGIKSFSAAYSGIEDNDNYNKIYQYDPLGPTVARTFGAGERLLCANVFPAESDGGVSCDEELVAVSFYTVDPGVQCRVYIVDDYKEIGDLVNFTPVVEKTIQDAGYHTLKLEEPITISKGNRFAIVVETINPTGAKQYVEQPFGRYTNAKGNANESFYSVDGTRWIDVFDTTEYKSTNMCIKAFTNINDASAYSLNAIDNEAREYDEQVTYSVSNVLQTGGLLNSDFVESYQEVSLMSVEPISDDEVAEEDIIPSIDIGSDVDYLDGGSLPTKYDLRNNNELTTVKNQGEFFNCWAFANIAALESSILKKMNNNIDGGDLDGSIGENDVLQSISFIETDILMAKNAEKQLKIQSNPIDTNIPITYESSNNSVVSVDTGGKIKGVGIGTAVITAYCGNLSAECTVMVTTGSSVQSVELEDNEITAEKGKNLLINYDIYPLDASNTNVTWKSSDTSVCDVNENGVITLNSVGTATVTVSTDDGNKTDTCQITVRDANMPCVVSITNNTLQKYREYLFGEVDVTIYNYESQLTGNLYVAIYDNSDKLISLQVKEKTLLFGETSEGYEFDIDNVTSSSGKVKAFLWDGITMKPLANSDFKEW